jgi:Putative prokaryotic signal transducing protein
MERFVEVYAAVDITLAYLIKAQLEDAGIPVQVTNEYLQGAYCLDGMVPRVLVPASHAEQAVEIIKNTQRASHHDPDDPAQGDEAGDEADEWGDDLADDER